MGIQHAVIFGAHCDDIVLSAGQLLAGRPGTLAVTVFAGDPLDPHVLAPCDVRSGFHSSADGMAVRRNEDRRALGVLECHAVHLEFPEHAYRELAGGQLDVDAVVAVMAGVLTRDTVAMFIPLGLCHPDHATVRECGLRVAEEFAGEVWLFEDLPYRVQNPEASIQALASIAGRGLSPAPAFAGSGDKERKRLAVSMYQSQLWALDLDCVFVPERQWRLR